MLANGQVWDEEELKLHKEEGKVHIYGRKWGRGWWDLEDLPGSRTDVIGGVVAGEGGIVGGGEGLESQKIGKGADRKKENEEQKGI